jgi:cytochrome c-550 PedF
MAATVIFKFSVAAMGRSYRCFSIHPEQLHQAPNLKTLMKKLSALAALSLTLAAAFAVTEPVAVAHGNVTPQPVDTAGLPKLKGPLDTNPYRGNKKAIAIGEAAIGQNCARCHGLGAVSGGIAPDLRYLPVGDDGDDLFQQRIRHGSIRNGVTYMPPFGDIFSEEAIWSIRSWLETIHQE